MSALPPEKFMISILLRRILSCIFLVVSLSMVYNPPRLGALSPGSDGFLERAQTLLGEVPLIDGHNDVPIQYRMRLNYDLETFDFAGDLTRLERPMHTDIDRLSKGRVGGVFWSVYIPDRYRGEPAVKATTEQIDFVYRLIDRYSDTLELAGTADDVERIFAGGKIASLIGMEGGHSINNSLSVLRQFYELGARYMTLTHSQNTDWADSATDKPQHNGLTDFGREIVREMNRVGMLVDLSHVSPATMHDALDVSEAPVIFSHSSAYSVTRHPRNVPDDVLKRLPENGGVVMVTFVPSFVSEDVRRFANAEDRERERLMREHGGNQRVVDRLINVRRESNPPPRATLAQVADHIDHIRDLIGVDYIGIGSDFDGIRTTPKGLEDVSKFPNLFAELFQRGYSEEDLKKIAGLNVLRVMREAEHVAERMQHVREPSQTPVEKPDSTGDHR
jgi:membrane dipeptidase